MMIQQQKPKYGIRLHFRISYCHYYYYYYYYCSIIGIIVIMIRHFTIVGCTNNVDAHPNRIMPIIDQWDLHHDNNNRNNQTNLIQPCDTLSSSSSSTSIRRRKHQHYYMNEWNNVNNNKSRHDCYHHYNDDKRRILWNVNNNRRRNTIMLPKLYHNNNNNTKKVISKQHVDNNNETSHKRRIQQQQQQQKQQQQQQHYDTTNNHNSRNMQNSENNNSSSNNSSSSSNIDIDFDPSIMEPTKDSLDEYSYEPTPSAPLLFTDPPTITTNITTITNITDTNTTTLDPSILDDGTYEPTPSLVEPTKDSLDDSSYIPTPSPQSSIFTNTPTLMNTTATTRIPTIVSTITNTTTNSPSITDTSLPSDKETTINNTSNNNNPNTPSINFFNSPIKSPSSSSSSLDDDDNNNNNIPTTTIDSQPFFIPSNNDEISYVSPVLQNLMENLYNNSNHTNNDNNTQPTPSSSPALQSVIENRNQSRTDDGTSTPSLFSMQLQQPVQQPSSSSSNNNNDMPSWWNNEFKPVVRQPITTSNNNNNNVVSRPTLRPRSQPIIPSQLTTDFIVQQHDQQPNNDGTTNSKPTLRPRARPNNSNYIQPNSRPNFSRPSNNNNNIQPSTPRPISRPNNVSRPNNNNNIQPTLIRSDTTTREPTRKPTRRPVTRRPTTRRPAWRTRQPTLTTPTTALRQPILSPVADVGEEPTAIIMPSSPQITTTLAYKPTVTIIMASPQITTTLTYKPSPFSSIYKSDFNEIISFSPTSSLSQTLSPSPSFKEVVQSKTFTPTNIKDEIIQSESPISVLLPTIKPTSRLDYLFNKVPSKINNETTTNMTNIEDDMNNNTNNIKNLPLSNFTIRFKSYKRGINLTTIEYILENYLVREMKMNHLDIIQLLLLDSYITEDNDSRWYMTTIKFGGNATFQNSIISTATPSSLTSNKTSSSILDRIYYPDLSTLCYEESYAISDFARIQQYVDTYIKSNIDIVGNNPLGSNVTVLQLTLNKNPSLFGDCLYKHNGTIIPQEDLDDNDESFNQQETKKDSDGSNNNNGINLDTIGASVIIVLGATLAIVFVTLGIVYHSMERIDKKRRKKNSLFKGLNTVTTGERTTFDDHLDESLITSAMPAYSSCSSSWGRGYNINGQRNHSSRRISKNSSGTHAMTNRNLLLSIASAEERNDDILSTILLQHEINTEAREHRRQQRKNQYDQLRITSSNADLHGQPQYPHQPSGTRKQLMSMNHNESRRNNKQMPTTALAKHIRQSTAQMKGHTDDGYNHCYLQDDYNAGARTSSHVARDSRQTPATLTKHVRRSYSQMKRHHNGYNNDYSQDDHNAAQTILSDMSRDSSFLSVYKKESLRGEGSSSAASTSSKGISRSIHFSPSSNSDPLEDALSVIDEDKRQSYHEELQSYKTSSIHQDDNNNNQLIFGLPKMWNVRSQDRTVSHERLEFDQQNNSRQLAISNNEELEEQEIVFSTLQSDSFSHLSEQTSLLREGNNSLTIHHRTDPLQNSNIIPYNEMQTLSDHYHHSNEGENECQLQLVDTPPNMPSPVVSSVFFENIKSAIPRFISSPFTTSLPDDMVSSRIEQQRSSSPYLSNSDGFTGSDLIEQQTTINNDETEAKIIRITNSDESIRMFI